MKIDKHLVTEASKQEGFQKEIDKLEKFINKLKLPPMAKSQLGDDVYDVWKMLGLDKK